MLRELVPFPNRTLLTLENVSRRTGKEERDYLGRTYLHVPNDVDGVNLRGTAGEQECFVPKRCVHTWSGHTKGVSRIQLFPGSGHLILSGSLDTRIKVRRGKSLPSR